MTIPEIYQQMEAYVLQPLSAAERSDLEKAVLHFNVQPNGDILSGEYYLNGRRHSLNIKDKY